MINPFRRRPARREHDPVEDLLRASLVERARRAPSGDDVAERIVTAAENAPLDRERAGQPVAPRRSWRTAALPLVAAAVVAAVVGGVVVIESHNPDSGRPAGENTGASVSSIPTVPAPVSSAATSPAGPAPLPSPTKSATLRNVKIIDLTFANQDDGWALGSADCLSGTGTCTAILRTLDGTTWTPMAGAAFNVPGVTGGCATKCVTHIRFANDGVGYAYGPDALFSTGNGGVSWEQEAGLGADALESINDNVVLVRALGTGKQLFERTDVGSSTWTSIPIPGGSFPAATGVSLSRTGATSVLALTRADPTKGSVAAATLYRSTDDQASKWTSAKDPCPAGGRGSVDVSAAATIAPDGAVVVDCASATTAGAVLGGRTITSTNDGTTFRAPAQGGKLGPAELLAASSAKVQFVVAASGKGDQLYRSADGGNSWSAVTSIPAGTAVFLGFENDQVGRFVTDGGTAIWTTRNAGESWTKASI